MNLPIQELLQKDMSRKDFLRFIGMGLLAVGGINTLLKSFENAGKTQKKSAGYGSSPYGR